MSKPEPKSKVKPKAKVVPKKPDAKHKLHKLRQKSSAKKGLTDLQKEMKLKPKEIEVTAQKKEIQEFIEGVLGIKQDSHVSKFLSGIAAWLMYKMGVGGKSEPLKDEEVFGKIDQERVKLLESGIIAHRGLNESGKENDKKTIEATLARGEKEVEFDVRLINGQLYLRHDPFEGKETDLVKFSKFTDILPLFAKHKDAKMFIDIKGGTKTANSVMDKILQADQEFRLNGNETLASRTSFISFNPEALKAVRQNEHMKQSPLYFVYVPTGGSMAAEALASGLTRTNTLSKSQLVKILGVADTFGGGTSYASSMKQTNVYMNGERMFKGANKQNEQLHFFSTLPSDDIVKMVRESKGGLIVPWGVVKNYPKIFKEAKAKGIKVGVFGFPSPSGNKEKRKQHKAEVQDALKMGANFIITDHAQMLSA